jgi:hypothetical protein
VFIRGKVLANGKEDLLAAVHRAGRGDGASPPALVEPGAYLAAARLLLVGGIQEWLVWLSTRPLRLCRSLLE